MEIDMNSIELIRCVLNEWDPLELFPMAPLDEYMPEVIQIEEFVNRDQCDGEVLGLAIRELMRKRFGDDVFTKSQDECMEVAKRILTLLSE